MALLLRSPPCSLPVRLIASRLFSSPSLKSYNSLSRLFFNTRTNLRARRALVGYPTQNARVFRAFMSSSLASEAFQEKSGVNAYSSEQIQVLEGLDPVRKRPGMYIGSTGPRGLHHLVYEILDNAIDEAQAGFASKIDVVLCADNSVSITDNGRGIPIDLHPITKKSALETVLTVLHAGGKFGGSSSGYSVSGGLHGVGLSVVNALSESLEVAVWRDGKEYRQLYSCGKPVTTLTSYILPSELSDRQGTCIRFWPDREVFTTTIEFDYNTIAGRIRELAFLNPELTITLAKEDADSKKAQSNEYCYSGGLVEYVKWLNTDKKPLHDVVSLRQELDGFAIDVALQWCSDAYADTMLGYANSIRTVDGGTHIDGMKASLTRTLNNLGKKSKLIKEKDISLSGEHVREGLTSVISVKVPNPEFEGQTKTRLGNPEVRRVVDQSIQEHLTEYLELHPDVLDSILSKSLNALKAAMAAKRARELVRTKSVLKSSSLPGKLADCSCTDPEESEIFIVEGDSAGGSAKQGRDRRFQAILPLRGKILNIERKDEAAMYKNEEIQNLIRALGLGVKGEDFIKLWNAPDAVALCGLFHSAYSNSYVNLAIFDPSTSRDTVRSHVGAAAERLIHLFCIVPRQPIIHDDLLFHYTDRELGEHLQSSELSIKDAKERGVFSSEEGWRKKLNSILPAEGISVKHIKTGEPVSVSRRVIAVFLFMTMADFSDQLFGFQDHLFDNENGRLEFTGDNSGSALWPGDGKPGLWLNSISRMGALYLLIVREEEIFMEERKRAGGSISNGSGGVDESRDEGIELVIPPVFESCTKVLDAEEQIAARDLYWEAVCDGGKGGLDRVEDLLVRCVERNPFVGEPHVVLGQVYLSRGRFGEAEREAEKGLELMLSWGSPWDKRTSWEGWIAWCRVLLMKAKERSWPKTAWGILNLGLVG